MRMCRPLSYMDTVSHGKEVRCHGVNSGDGVRPSAAMSARNEPSRLFTFPSIAGKFRVWTSHAQRQKAKGLKVSLLHSFVKDFRFRACQRNLGYLYLQMEDRAICLHDARLPSFRYEASSRSVPRQTLQRNLPCHLQVCCCI